MTQIPAGWYPDPAPQTLPGRQRYWDGGQWTQHVHDPQPVYAPPVYPSQQYAQPYAPVPVPVPTTPDGQQLSGWWRRVLAQVLDSLVLAPVWIGILAAFVAGRWDEISTWFDDYSSALDAGTTPPPAPDLFQPFSTEMLGLAAAYVVVLAIYTLGFWRWKQATPGKLMVGLRIRRRETPGPMPWPTMLARFLFVQALALGAYVPWLGFLFLIAGLLDYLWPLWDEKKQALHDKVARTNVVLAAPTDQSPGDQPTPTELTAAGMPRRW